MKKLPVFWALAAIVALTATTASATQLMVDNFDTYAVGNLVPQGGWAAHSGAGNSPVQVINPGLSGNGINVTGGSGSREDVNKAVGSTMCAGSVWYAGFCADVLSVGTSDDYFAHFYDQGTTYYGARVHVGTVADQPTKFRLGISSSTDATQWLATTFDLASDDYLRIVTSYDYDSRQASLWVNPVDEASYHVSTTLGQYSNAFDAYAFRQGSGAYGVDIDNLAVGTAFGDVSGGCVPEPTTLAMLLSGGLLGLVAVARRRRGQQG